MKLKKILLLLFVLSFTQLYAQFQLSEKATLSVITCGSGQELYSTFGHSAFRVHDALNGIDRIYNYGTFDFNTPNFYLNFAKGKLTYQLSVESFDNFIRIYNYEKRWVKTQVLNLKSQEVQEVFNYLENNAESENKNYKYDFFYNNCATKIEDVIKIVLKEKVHFTNEHITSHKSHRDLIEDYTNQTLWGKFGIDLALGSVIDKEAKKNDYKFLPDYIYQSFANATIIHNNEEQALVLKELSILKFNSQKNSNFITTPFGIILLLSLLIAFVTFKNHQSQKRSKWLDFSIYFTTGFIGIVVLLLWFATDHTATYNNYNVLWAFAPNLFVSFYLLKTKLPGWLKQYNKFLLLLILSMMVLWVLKIQVFNHALIPLFVAIIMRYLYINKKKTINGTIK